MPVNCENSNIIGPGCNFLFAFISVTLAQWGNKPFLLFHSYQPFVSLCLQRRCMLVHGEKLLYFHCKEQLQRTDASNVKCVLDMLNLQGYQNSVTMLCFQDEHHQWGPASDRTKISKWFQFGFHFVFFQPLWLPVIVIKAGVCLYHS